jgi:hypothetical protein
LGRAYSSWIESIKVIPAVEGRKFIGSILWRNIKQKGHEICHLSSANSGYYLEGIAVFLHAGAPCLLSYWIACDRLWQTESARVEGLVGQEKISRQVMVDQERHWWLNGVEVPEVSGSIDLDLNFSPCTNMLPIRRLGLQVGERASFIAAWLKFPSFNLAPLPQQYERLRESIYRYSSNNRQFVADLAVNSHGFVTDYPGIWTAETD